MSSLFLGGMRRVYEYSVDELNRNSLVIRHARMCSWISSLKISMSTLWLGALQLRFSQQSEAKRSELALT